MTDIEINLRPNWTCKLCNRKHHPREWYCDICKQFYYDNYKDFHKLSSKHRVNRCRALLKDTIDGIDTHDHKLRKNCIHCHRLGILILVQGRADNYVETPICLKIADKISKLSDNQKDFIEYVCIRMA